MKWGLSRLLMMANGRFYWMYSRLIQSISSPPTTGTHPDFVLSENVIAALQSGRLTDLGKDISHFTKIVGQLRKGQAQAACNTVSGCFGQIISMMRLQK